MLNRIKFGLWFMIFLSKTTGKFAEITFKYLIKEFWFLSEKFKSLLCLQKLLTVRKDICSNLTLPDTQKQKGLPNNQSERTHDVLACNQIVVRTRVQGTFGKMSQCCISRFSFKEKRKGKKGVFELIVSIGCVEKRSRSNLLLTRLRKKMGKVERF